MQASDGFSCLICVGVWPGVSRCGVRVGVGLRLQLGLSAPVYLPGLPGAGLGVPGSIRGSGCAVNAGFTYCDDGGGGGLGRI